MHGANLSAGYWLSIPAAAIAAWLIGLVWYSPLLFAKGRARAATFRTYAGTFLALLMTAGVLRLFLSHQGADSIHDGFSWGFHLWLGFALPIGFTASLFSDRPSSTFLIDAGYQLVYLSVMGLILGVLR